MADVKGHLPRGPGRILKAAKWSWQGLRAAWLHESSFRLEVWLLLLAVPLALWLGDSGLERALPENCGVKSVTMKDGVVTVNFSKEFKQAMESSDGGQQAVRAILFTCSQFPGVKKVEVQVEGEKIEAQPETATTFINAEEEVIAQYPGVVELD